MNRTARMPPFGGGLLEVGEEVTCALGLAVSAGACGIKKERELSQGGGAG
jgi:hypothetical protein